jgi:WD40 repeat protein
MSTQANRLVFSLVIHHGLCHLILILLVNGYLAGMFLMLLCISDTVSSYDGKAKVWGMSTKGCVATHDDNEKPVWCVKWLPKTGRTEMFVMAGANRSISFYREASGG